jgi:hypothetical protein
VKKLTFFFKINKTEKMRYFLLLLVSLIIGIYSDNQTDVVRNKNRLYFSIDSLGYGIIIPLQLNDSITANMVFDTGAGEDIVLDSAFVVTNDLLPNTYYEKGIKTYPLGKLNGIPTLTYHTSLPIKIGETVVYYSTLDACRIPWNRNSTVNGFFSIPQTDTTHVWELNFENSYIEIHDFNRFQMPEGFLIAPLADLKTPYYYIQIPLQILCDDDTLRSNYTYMIDTGNPYVEILWLSPTPETEVLSKQDDYELYSYMGFSSWQNTVKAVLWDSLTADTLKTNLFAVSPEYYKNFHNVGLNFLKRFNVFFDLKNRQVGLQPIAHKRLKAPNEGVTYYFVDTMPTLNGHYRINYMPAFKKNYYQVAGLREGDEIVLWNGHPYSDILHGKIPTDVEDSVIYHILRDDQPVRIVVPIPTDDEKNENR